MYQNAMQSFIKIDVLVSEKNLDKNHPDIHLLLLGLHAYFSSEVDHYTDLLKRLFSRLKHEILVFEVEV